MSNYVLSEQLKRAVEVALHLDRPLLLCGEPGTGKTTLAKHLAKEYSATPPGNYAPFHHERLFFSTKTASTATDLFYSYDALNRFRDAYAQLNRDAGDYIELKALGRAIAFKHGVNSQGLDAIRNIRDFKEPCTLPKSPLSSIVLIDEIDKAPRDFPNDILTEIEKLVFEIKETGGSVVGINNNAKILIIMTSNNEKNLPDAFLRRCVYHYIDFPNEQLLDEIIKSHFPVLKENKQPKIMGIINTFNELRKLPLLKKPATAEFIDWLRILESCNLLVKATQPYEKLPDDVKSQLKDTLGVLLKNNNDISVAKEALKNM